MRNQQLKIMVVLLLIVLTQLIVTADVKEREQQIEDCMENLNVIGAAIETYKLDHQGEAPDWLSDLYPEYLQDTQLLLCSADKTAGSPAIATDMRDPKIPCSYHYVFNPMKSLGTIFDANPPKDPAYKEAMKMSLRYFGDLTPVIRCRHHGARVLNLGHDGNVYISPGSWDDTPEAISAFLSFFRNFVRDNPEDWEERLSLEKIYGYLKSCKRLPDFRAILEQQSNLSANALKILAEIYHLPSRQRCAE